MRKIMGNCIIFKNQRLLNNGKAATHAIVIGVGEYLYLTGGSGGKVTKLDGGLQQLSSPPESAVAFAEWLLEKFNNPEKPLATLSLLVSRKGGPLKFNHQKLPGAVTLEPATIDYVKDAIREWYDFGDRNEKNLLLFFYCGHGVSRGLEELALLMSDYGEDDRMPMEGAIDFAALHRGMNQCRAIQQCYFIDACRKISDIAARTTATGNPIIQDNLNRPYSSPRNDAVFYSTLGGEAAYGRKNKPSYYTEELIKGLNGLGSNNRNAEGKWRVSTGDLNTAIHRGLFLRGDKISEPMTHQVYFEFHELKKDPLALAIVFCDPRTDHELATLSCRQKNKKIDSRAPAKDDWEVIIPYGHYDFIAQIQRRKGRKPNQLIWPPYKEIKIEVAP